MHNIKHNRLSGVHRLLSGSCIYGIAALLVFPLVGNAAPSVSGDTVSWPDDGWYQVQHADTYETVCEGSIASSSAVAGGPCRIDSGRYIVINHSSGERFENITAANTSSASDTAVDSVVDSVVVNGATISWPNDGWYQVQNADTFVSVCEGGRSCEVSAGTYVVINHSSGERFEGIAVNSVASPPPSDRPAAVRVDAQVISWPDDGWYQVQRLPDYSSVCEGGSECSVDSGDYVVINHNTGVRTELAVPSFGIGSGSGFDPGAEPDDTSLTFIEFDITVPVYVSNELQVVLTWADRRLNANWVIDESWELFEEFPRNTEIPVTITFHDRNGAITLATYEQTLNTATFAEQQFVVNADEFNSDNWDDDGDGTSNLDELLAGSDPRDANSTAGDPANTDLPIDNSVQQQEAFDFFDVNEDLTRSLAGFQMDKMNYFVRDVFYQAAQQTMLQLPGDGYYEVQLDNGSVSTPPVTVCEGTGACRILPGNYIVINHTTGERSEQFVPYVDSSEVPNATVLPERFNSTASNDGPITIERTQYNCEHGGTLIREYSENQAPVAETLLIDAPEYRMISVRERNTTSYLFDQCRLDLIDTTLPDGTYVFNGNHHYNYSEHNFGDYTGYVTNAIYWDYEDFSIVGDDGIEYQVNGAAERYHYQREGGNIFHRIRKTVLDKFVKKAAGGQIIESVANGRYDHERAWFYGGYASATSEQVSGIVRTAATAHQEISVQTLSALTGKFQREGYTGVNAESPFSGIIEMLADDGSLLVIQADPVKRGPQFYSLWAVSDLTTAGAEQVTRGSEPYSSPGTSPRICAGDSRYTSWRPYRNSVTRRIYCGGGDFAEF